MLETLERVESTADSADAVANAVLGPWTQPLGTLDPGTVVVPQSIHLVVGTLDLKNTPVAFNPPEANSRLGPPFDIDARISGRDPGEAVKIVITLQDQDVYFRTDAWFITAGTLGSFNFLKRGNLPVGAEPREIEFFAIRDDANQYLHFNIGLHVKDTHPNETWVLPIFIDPKIENNG